MKKYYTVVFVKHNTVEVIIDGIQLLKLIMDNLIFIYFIKKVNGKQLKHIIRLWPEMELIFMILLLKYLDLNKVDGNLINLLKY